MLSAEHSRKPVVFVSFFVLYHAAPSHLSSRLIEGHYRKIRILTSAADDFLEEKWMFRHSRASHGHGPDLYINEQGSKVWEIQPGLGSFG
jgi:hypothetical protein